MWIFANVWKWKKKISQKRENITEYEILKDVNIIMWKYKNVNMWKMW